MNVPTISIALCTYNGSKYIKTQIESLINQTLKPSEIVICDDNSSDNTLEIIRSINAPFPIRIYENKPALRTVKNFERAVSLCTGDVIMLCDQDDFWVPTKLEVMGKYMLEHPKTNVLFSNALLVDENLNSLGKKMWETVNLEEHTLQRWRNGHSTEILMAGNRVTGCTMCFRRSFVSEIVPFPTQIDKDFIHDGWIAMLASITNSIDFINEDLIWYRQHSAQQVGAKNDEFTHREKVTLKNRFTRPKTEKVEPFLEKAVFYKKIIDYILENTTHKIDDLVPLTRAYEHYNLRAELPFRPRYKRFIPALVNYYKGNYHKYCHLGSSQLGILQAMIGDIVE
ncbi:glycosyltransferase family 2 protein [Flectobacillus sp. BAB-3569]|uniref:glycosyltransferase family 2 protein n=1 Tax=Flectobacillus sp. BAB-3569 TaxID=1509483 RepID=UPI000BA419C6|nr:glycosyltransferase family 2 protein [Flectobacillus sp. BAB-3569]PAC31630.1 glycosyl transferase family 2 [Flectobacillus sp. BAB-3569]